ncbi:MAG: hypothetical protein AAF757_24695 [Cyanobacteria bacterium P01_D01_bin.116]
MSTDDERKHRLSFLCKRLRGNESLRSFTKKRSKQLQGISHASWSVWERGAGDLSRDSLERLVSFIGCSYKSLLKYLNGSITLEELLEPTLPIVDESEEELTLSPDAAAFWMKSLPLKDQLFIVSQGFQSFQEHLDKLVEEKARELIQNEAIESIDSDIQKLIQQRAEELVNNKVKKELAQEAIEETSKLLLGLFSNDKYPLHSEIIKVAEKLDLNIQDLLEICDRIYLDKTQEQHKQSA